MNNQSNYSNLVVLNTDERKISFIWDHSWLNLLMNEIILKLKKKVKGLLTADQMYDNYSGKLNYVFLKWQNYNSKW